MFTGIIEELGVVTLKEKITEGYKFRIKAQKTLKKLKVSDSISVNGACHTVITKSKNEFEFITMHETLKKTNLGKLKEKDIVNLENTLRLGSELGGHFVLGHIDDTGVITSIKQVKKKTKAKSKSENWEVKIKVHKKYKKYLINVGSIAIDGVSLTVAKIYSVKKNHFEIKVAIIPYTYNHTNFHSYKVGDKVNLEFDFLGKYMLNIIKKKKLKKN